MFFNFGGIGRATRLFHTAGIDELMAEPPVAGAALPSARDKSEHAPHPATTEAEERQRAAE